MSRVTHMDESHHPHELVHRQLSPKNQQTEHRRQQHDGRRGYESRHTFA